MYFCKGYDFGEKVDLSKGKKVLYSEFYSMNVNHCWRQNVTFQLTNFWEILLVLPYRDADFVRPLGYRFENDFLANDDICDIFSGQEYCKLMQPSVFLSKDNPLKVSFSFNTDGVLPYKSSNKQNFWPIFLVINELPPRLRWVWWIS